MRGIATLLPGESVRRRVALLCLPVIAVLAVLGALVAREKLHARAFNLDLEGTVPAIWSGLLLWGAAYAGLLAYRGGERRWFVAVLAGVFLYMGFDEMLSVHEDLQELTGVDWQTLLSPVILLAGVAYVFLLRAEWGGPEMWLWLGGGFCWFSSQVLEHLEWHDDQAVNGYLKMMWFEEIGEMIGSLLFMLTLIALWERRQGPVEVAGEPTRVRVGA